MFFVLVEVDFESNWLVFYPNCVRDYFRRTIRSNSKEELTTLCVMS